MNELIERYPEFMNWYWSWGIFVSGIIVFLFGVFMGWIMHKERCEKLLHKERVRLATTNTIPAGKIHGDNIKPVMLEDAWDKS